MMVMAGSPSIRKGHESVTLVRSTSVAIAHPDHSALSQGQCLFPNFPSVYGPCIINAPFINICKGFTLHDTLTSLRRSFSISCVACVSKIKKKTLNTDRNVTEHVEWPAGEYLVQVARFDPSKCIPTVSCSRRTSLNSLSVAKVQESRRNL